MTINQFIQQPGAKASRPVKWSHFKDPIPNDGKPHGNSRAHGDASPEVQQLVINTLVNESAKQGLSKKETAVVLAIARIESGFNPDAAAGSSSAAGVGQFIDGTGSKYGLNDSNRFDIEANSKALVAHFIENRDRAQQQGKGLDHVYKFHHDGASSKEDRGGMHLSRTDVMPTAASYRKSSYLDEAYTNAKEFFNSVEKTAKATYAKVENTAKEVVHDIEKAVDKVVSPSKPKRAPAPVVEMAATPVEKIKSASIKDEKETSSPTEKEVRATLARAQEQDLHPDALKALLVAKYGGPENTANSEQAVAKAETSPKVDAGLTPLQVAEARAEPVANVAVEQPPVATAVVESATPATPSELTPLQVAEARAEPVANVAVEQPPAATVVAESATPATSSEQSPLQVAEARAEPVANVAVEQPPAATVVAESATPATITEKDFLQAEEPIKQESKGIDIAQALWDSAPAIKEEKPSLTVKAEQLHEEEKTSSPVNKASQPVLDAADSKEGANSVAQALWDSAPSIPEESRATGQHVTLRSLADFAEEVKEMAGRINDRYKDPAALSTDRENGAPEKIKEQETTRNESDKDLKSAKSREVEELSMEA